MPKIVFIGVILLGISLKFLNLDQQEFYHDEAASLMLTLGNTPPILFKRLGDVGALPAAEFLATQQDKDNEGIIISMRKFHGVDPLRPPLYYALNRVWISFFGDSVFAVRSLSAVIMCFLLPGIWLLVFALFQNTTLAWLALLFSAVSPFESLIGRTAREYALWLCLTIFAQVAFLKRKWAAYSALSILSFFTSLFTIPIILANVLYLAFTRSEHLSRFLKITTLVLVLVLAFVVPWSDISARNWLPVFGGMSWAATPVSSWQYLLSLVSSAYKVFFDIDLETTSPLTDIILAAPALILVASVEIAALRKMLSHNALEKTNRLFLFAFGGCALVPTLGVDLLFGGHRALSPRYQLGFYLFLEIAVVWFLGSMYLEGQRRQKLARSLIAAFVCLGLLSQLKICEATTWWNKSYGTDAYEIASHIVGDDQSLVVASDIYDLVALARYLPPQVQMTTLFAFNSFKPQKSYQHIYLLRESEQVRNFIAATSFHYPSPIVAGLWELK